MFEFRVMSHNVFMSASRHVHSARFQNIHFSMNQLCGHGVCGANASHECTGCGWFLCGWHSQSMNWLRDERGLGIFMCSDGCRNVLESIEYMNYQRMKDKEACRVRRSECSRCRGHFLLYDSLSNSFRCYTVDICSECRVEGYRRLRQKALRTQVAK